MILLADDGLAARRAAAAPDGPLAPLFDSLAAELRPMLGREVYVPAEKALLSRTGGRCERDGTTLEFDPWSPREHRCPRCGSVYRGELHDRAWITHYQLWLAERAVHASLFNLLRPDAAHEALARDILTRLADAYRRYPNRDNVLGPTRPFFSTYLESIWLLQICLATDLLRAANGAGIDQIVEGIVEPSRILIAEYDEGASNRQVWNNAALMSAATLVGDQRAFDRVLHASSGLLAHLRGGLLPDGSWYEGENYHLFAVRGLWYGVAMCDARNVPLPADLDARFQRAFEFPFLTALPDFTMPSRKDSQYAVSLRQWRIAEITELGFARRQSAALGAALRRCYEPVGERRDGGRARSTADAERNAQPSRITRADLGWRALLHALPELPPLPQASPRSVLLDGQGIAVFRRDGDAYAAMEYGQSGGGHGHPDRLNLMVSVGETRWLDDMGTGSYVDPSLHWYRSTLAHNAPLVDGASQPMRSGTLAAFDERGACGWIEATLELDDPVPVTITRTLVVATDYLISILHWDAERPCQVDLPWHLEGEARDLAFAPALMPGGDGLEDGFGFPHDVTSAALAASTPARILATRDGRSATLDLMADTDTTLFAASAPGQPATTTRRFHVVRARGRTGEMRAVLSWGPRHRVEFTPERTVIHVSDIERHDHLRATDGGWRMELRAGDSRSSIELGGRRPPTVVKEPVRPAMSPLVIPRSNALPEWLSDARAEDRRHLVVRELGRAHYRRSEASWEAAGRPTATVAIGATADDLRVYVVSRAGDPIFAPAEATNPYDNEHADTMAAGVQLHLRTGIEEWGWMLVPEAQPPVVRARATTSGNGFLAAQWRPIAGGWEMTIVIPITLLRVAMQSETADQFQLDVLVNETVAGRERRRGQLVLSGAAGEWVYLRGDRQDPDRFLTFQLTP